MVLFIVDCAAACPEGALRFTGDHRLAARGRDDLVTGGVTADGFLPAGSLDPGTYDVIVASGGRIGTGFGTRALRFGTTVATPPVTN